jgi:hypothetical protein
MGFSSGRQRRRNLRRLIQLFNYIPRQQLLDAIDRMIGDALEYVMKIAPRRLPDNPPPVAGSKSPTWRRRDAG